MVEQAMQNACIMGFDYGSRQIGVAIGQMLTFTASPLAIITCRRNQPDWVRISSLVHEWQPMALVVGLPFHADGSDSETSRAARSFGQQLCERYQLPMHYIDERLSSVAAAERSGRSDLLDAIAAQIILETWLAECH